MIVKCEQCQTRFKIPDDKVTEKGVKVRCTKCSHTFRVTRDMAQPAAPGVPSAADPFARFGAVSEPPGPEVTRPGIFALGIEATRSPELGSRRTATAPPFPAVAPSAPPAPFDFGSLSPPAPAYAAPAPYAASPFDFSAIAPPTAAAAPAPAAFDFSNFAAPAQVAPPPRAAPVVPPPASQTSAFDFAPPAAHEGGALPAFDFGQPSDLPRSSAPMDDGAQHQLQGGGDGFFGAADGHGSMSEAEGAAARAMFDLPAPPPAPASSLPDVPMPDSEPAAPAAAPTTLGRVSITPSAAPLPPDEPARRRSIVGIVVNVVIAAVLVLGLIVVGSALLNEGKLTSDSLSLESLKNTFAPSVEFVASDVSNGLYETRTGRSVFFVRGEVTNRSQATVKVVVKAEIVEDGTVVRFGESWAGEPATPEEIFLIDSSEALEALNRKVEKRALVVPPDSAAIFVVPFTEYPPELKGFRVRVSARAVPVSPTAANP